ncbi:MAG: hypothetical protein CFE35_21380 [Novosphingobium sp. PASSN1]|nr:MAG: hypothetical protein CFE35_21380 [Novosphingobium sp. PASSN1]
MPLTETQARNAKPTDRAYKLSDSEGLFLLVQPNGTCPSSEHLGLLRRLIDIFQPDECVNYFSSCGYDLD